MIIKETFLFALTIIAMNSCGPSTGPLQFRERVVAAQVPQVSTTLLEKVQKELLEPRCSSCHGWISDLQGLLKRITPGDEMQSGLYLRMEDGSMPLFGTSLNEEELQRVAEAIRALKE